VSLVITPEPIEGIIPLLVDVSYTPLYRCNHAAWAGRVSAGSFGS